MTDSEKVIKALFSGYNKLMLSRKTLDEINVFPVADGDTGSNMTRTMKAGAEAVKYDKDKSVFEILSKCSKAMLRSARGNSGVILSVLFKGFSDFLRDAGQLSASQLYGAFDCAIRQTESALSSPVYEGTILSVALAARDEAEKNTEEEFGTAWENICNACKAALEETKNAMPELKHDKIPDSGALGLYYIILAAREVVLGKAESDVIASNVTFRKISAVHEDDYTYCTEFLIMKENSFPVSLLENNLEKIGDSVAVVEDDSIVKVHLHTNFPNQALGYAMRYGLLTDIKIDNMTVMKNSK